MFFDRKFRKHEISKIALLLIGRFNERAEEVAKLLSNYYDAEDVQHLLGAPPSKPSILIIEDKPEVEQFYRSEMEEWADLIVIGPSSMDNAFMEHAAEIRLVLVGADVNSDLMQVMLGLRRCFLGTMAVVYENDPSMNEVLRAGRCGCDAAIQPQAQVPAITRSWLAEQGEGEKNSVGGDWLGLALACLHLKSEIAGMTMFDIIAIINHNARDAELFAKIEEGKK